jgi:GH18 family chitinase
MMIRYIPEGKVLLYVVLTTLLFFGCSKDDDPIKPDPDPQEEELIDIYVEDPSFKVVGYFPYYRFSAVNSIDFSKLNYVNIAFANFDVSGNIKVGSGTNISSVVSQIKSEGAKVFLSLGGGGLNQAQEDKWLQLLNSSNRANSIHKILNYLNANNLDGVDVDIEGTLLTSLGNNYNLFIKELRAHLHAENKGITAAVYPISVRQNITSTTLKSFDFLNVMAYNEKGLWDMDNPGQHSSYEFAQEALDFWMGDQAIDASKLVLGMPFYGIDFDPAVASSKTYSDIIAEDPMLAFSDNHEAIYYNGIPTIVKKTQLAKEMVNGTMIWELGQDNFMGYSLLNAIGSALSLLPCAEDVQVFFLDSDGDGKGDHTNYLIACEQPEGYVLDYSDTDDADPST